MLYNKTLVVKNLTDLVEKSFNEYSNNSDLVINSTMHIYYDAKSKNTFCDLKNNTHNKTSASVNQKTTTKATIITTTKQQLGSTVNGTSNSTNNQTKTTKSKTRLKKRETTSDEDDDDDNDGEEDDMADDEDDNCENGNDLYFTLSDKNNEMLETVNSSMVIENVANEIIDGKEMGEDDVVDDDSRIKKSRHRVRDVSSRDERAAQQGYTTTKTQQKNQSKLNKQILI